MSCVSDGSGGSRCEICGDGEEEFHTLIGCKLPPTAISCGSGLNLWLDGRCWDEFDGLPAWECEADCQELYGPNGWCMNGLDWRADVENTTPILAAYPHTDPDYDFGAPMCASTDCDGFGAECAAQGQACNEQTGNCAAECAQAGDCQASVPAPAYPIGFVCMPSTNTCAL